MQTLPSALAIPKSATFTRPSPVSSTFSGLRSRWTIPCACRLREARQDALQHARDLREREAARQRPQRAALEVLHRDVRRAVVLEEVDRP